MVANAVALILFAIYFVIILIAIAFKSENYRESNTEKKEIFNTKNKAKKIKKYKFREK